MIKSRQVDKALGAIDDLASSIALFNETYVRFNHLVKPEFDG